MNFTPDVTTLLAASLAAITSIITLIVTLVVNISANKSAEMRVSYRQSLEKYLPELSDAIHSVIATSTILTQAKTEPAVKNWRAKAEKAQEKLKELRVNLRYSLWGITDALNTLTRLPDWTEHARGFPENEKQIVENGGKLAGALDFAIRNSYNFGRPPTYIERFWVWIAQLQLESVYKSFKDNGKKAES